jgi:hypothetical protein
MAQKEQTGRCMFKRGGRQQAEFAQKQLGAASLHLTSNCPAWVVKTRF